MSASEERKRQVRALAARDGNYCQRCGVTGIALTLDHVIPRAKGGPNSLSNLQLLCRDCNGWKGMRVYDYRNINIPFGRKRDHAANAVAQLQLARQRQELRVKLTVEHVEVEPREPRFRLKPVELSAQLRSVPVFSSGDDAEHGELATTVDLSRLRDGSGYTAFR